MEPITIISLGLAILCLSGALLFFILKEKGAILVSGFDSIPENQKDKYDKKKISLDMRNTLLLWGIILLLGTILSQSIHEYFGVDVIGTFDKYKK